MTAKDQSADATAAHRRGFRMNDMLSEFVASAPVQVALFDGAMRYLAWSQDWAAFIGMADHDLEGLCHFDLVPGHLSVWQAALREALSGEDVACDEVQVAARDGDAAWLRWRMHPVRGDTGDIVAAILFADDISDRKAAEASLAAGDERLRLVTSALEIGIVETDFRSGRTYLSDDFRALLGLGPDIALDHADGWLTGLGPECRAAFETARDTALAPGADGRFGCEIQPVVDGQPRVMQLRARIFADTENGQRRPDRLIGVLVDETDQRHMQDALVKAQRLETVGRLAGVIAHDFNNILTVILSNLELADLRSGDDRVKDLLAQAIEAAEMGAGFNKRLLALAGGRFTQAAALNVDEHIGRTWDVFQRVMNDQIALHFEPGAAKTTVVVDPAELDGAILNLVVNARDAQPEGGRIVVRTERVTLDAAAAQELDGGRDGDFLHLSVTDEGAGMPADVARRAKEPFFTTKTGDRGTGLGLTSVAITAERAGGFVHIASERGQGTEVSLYLPCSSEAASAAVAENEDYPFGSGELVLVVEDDPLVREAVMQRLEAIGYAVVEAGNATAALALLEAGEPVDLVFSDVVMPGGPSGYDLVHQVRQFYPGVGVLLTSGHVSRMSREWLETGTDVPLLSKPYSLRTLAECVAQALRLVEAEP